MTPDQTARLREEENAEWCCAHCDKLMTSDGFIGDDNIHYCSEECFKERDASR